MKRLLALVLSGLFAASSFAALPTQYSFTISLTPSGKIQTKYRDGNDTTPAIPLVWGTVASITRSTGSTYNIDLCTTYLTEPAPPTSTLTVLAGHTLPTGWSLGGTRNCTLSYDGAGTAFGSVRIRATRLTATADTAAFDLSGAAPAAADTTAPNTPTGITAVGGTGTVTISGNTCYDPYVSEAGSGCKDAQIYADGVLVGTVTVPSGTSHQFTLANIGTVSPTPTCTPSGATLTVVSVGTGIEGAADQFGYCYATISGAFKAVAKLNSLTAGDYNKAFGDIRGTNAADQAAMNCGTVNFAPGGTYLAQCRTRPTTGGSRTNQVNSPLGYALPGWWSWQRNADGTWTTQTSVDGNTFSAQLTDYVLPLPTTVNFGLGTTSTGGSAATAVWDQVAITTGTRWTFEHTTATARSYTVRYRDNLLNTSVLSAAVIGTPSAGGGAAVRWHPGHYVAYVPTRWYRMDEAAVIADVLTFIDSIESDTNIKGIQISPMWRALENSQGDYTDGFNMMDQILARATLRGKKVMLQVYSGITGNYGTPYDYWPPYIIDNPSYGITVGGNPGYQQVFARKWQQPVMDRLIEMFRAYGARYNSNTALEMVGLGETAIAIYNGADGFSNSALLAQYGRLIPAVRAAFPNVNVRLVANDFWPDSLGIQLLQTCATYYCSVGGPDVWPADTTQMDRVFIGKNQAAQTVSTNWVGQMPWTVEIQSPELAGQFTFQQLYDAPRIGYTADNGYVMPAMGLTHLIWYKNDWTGPSNRFWSVPTTGEKAFINANPSMGTTACPTLYPSCDTTAIIEPELYAPAANDDTFEWKRAA